MWQAPLVAKRGDVDYFREKGGGLFFSLDVSQVSIERQALRNGTSRPSEDAGTAGRHWRRQDTRRLQPCAEVGTCGQRSRLRKVGKPRCGGAIRPRGSLFPDTREPEVRQRGLTSQQALHPTHEKQWWGSKAREAASRLHRLH